MMPNVPVVTQQLFAREIASHAVAKESHHLLVEVKEPRPNRVWSLIRRTICRFNTAARHTGMPIGTRAR